VFQPRAFPAASAPAATANIVKAIDQTILSGRGRDRASRSKTAAHIALRTAQTIGKRIIG
jgi:hypothetical protein